MPKLPEPTSCPPLPVPDLTRFTEATRRALYDLVLAIVFTEPYLQAVGYRCGLEPPIDTAERSGLEVFAAYGRWFAAWRDLEAEPSLPLDRHIEVVRIKEDPDAEYGIMFHEV